jgi:diketogulonate reductase-like aldo/keto reductase
MASNEAEVGTAVQSSSTGRSAVFLTTKLGQADKIQDHLDDSVRKMDPSPNGHVDLFLIHSPSAGPEKREEQWRALEGLVKDGKAKAIGVSN